MLSNDLSGVKIAHVKRVLRAIGFGVTTAKFRYGQPRCDICDGVKIAVYFKEVSTGRRAIAVGCPDCDRTDWIMTNLPLPADGEIG